jgi:polysaccharide deacetylase family protein (PEP-CTERM system associated)
MRAPAMPQRPRLALTVDVEEYFQVWAFAGVVPRAAWESLPSRVEYATRRALDLLDEHAAQATFFTLGWIVRRFPKLVREIAARGHEVASHGLDHAKVVDQSAEEFRADALVSKMLLEDACGEAVRGYRAPGFSIGARVPWAYEILAEAGYCYSSSVHPIAHDHYGDARAPRSPFSPLPGSDFIEAPVATAEVFGRRIACGGGGWLRITPYPVFNLFLRRAARMMDGAPVVYFHPWELDPEQPRIKGASMKSAFRHYVNLDRTEAKLRRLLADWRCGRLDEALGVRPALVAAA